MRLSRFSALVLALAFPAIGCDSTNDEDSGVTPDTGVPTDSGDVDGGGEVTDTGGGTDAPVVATCGTARPDVSNIRGTEGLIIGRDGTIFYGQSGGVGRMTPDGTQDDDWVSLSGAGTVWGLALDAANETLYVGSPSAGRVFAITISSGDVTTFVDAAGQPNGLTVGPDGALYFSDFGGGAVRRATSTGMTTVTTSPIPQANGVAFDAEGRLIVLSYGSGRLLRLTLADGVETSREPMVAMGLGNPDGVALDSNGDFWVSDNGGRNLRHVIAATGANTTELSSIPAAASVDFGAGPLDCHDVYIASSGAVQRFTTSVEGANVLWH
jgi:sugar lactone lactonase YvrE